MANGTFQTQVEVYYGVGVVGQPASNAPIIAAAGGPVAYVAAEAGVTIGTFVFRTAAGATTLTNVAPATDSVPVGFVQSLGQASITSGNGYSMLIPGGRELSPKVAGDFWVVSSTVATEGQKVFASVTDGSIATGAAGATVTGYVETPFYVSAGAAVGDLVIISRWSQQ